MEKEIKFYRYVDGINDTPFPSKESQIRTSSFTYNADRMGGAPSITATVMHKLCLDDYWNKYVYVQFNGEKYYVRNTPSSSKSNDDTRYKHEVELLSEREDLNHVYFVDAVQGDSSVDVYKSNTTKVTFMGDIVEFVARLNSSLQYSGLSYNAVIDSGITSEDKLVSFENKYIMEALQEIFNIYELPYYFVGKTIHIGYTENAIPNVMRYGRYDALLSISKDNANYLVINRITGIGGTENIPYYYPNETDDRSQVDKWITPTQNLMPSVYRESKGAKLFYNAENNKYPDGEGGYYKFDNPYSQNNILEGSVSFPEIYPTIKEMTNGSGQRIDMFSAFAYDQNDNDEIDEETNEYVHPYFFAKLRKLDGPNGFNLFDQAIEQQAMQISMTSGVCGSCTFEIGVGEETNKNIVQVDDSGNLLRDENGNVLRSGSPQARQNDTKNYEVWIALKKDDTTFPIVMPNAQDNFRPSTSDTFVILGINLPQGYVTAAEEKLEQSLIKHMWMNNREKFTFSIKFSRIFFEENPTILSRLNENARLLIEYNGQQHTLYVNSFTYKMDESTPLPEIEVDLVDTLTVGSNSLQNRLDSVKQDILSSIGGADFLKQGLKYFLRKDVSDTAIGFLNFLGGGMVRKDLFFGREIEGEERYKISGELGDAYLRDIAGRLFTMREGFQTDNFAAGMTGAGVGTYNKAELHMDKAVVRKYIEVLALVVAQMFYRGGRQVLSPAGMKVNRVEEGDTYYRLFMETEDGQVNEFTVGAQARCNRYSTVPRYWWRLVTAIGTDYIDVSKTDCDEGSMAPEVGDEVVQFGHRTDPYLQWVVMDSSYPDDAGRSIYGGVDSYSLDGKMILREGVDPKDPNRIGLFLRNGAEISDIINEIDESIGDITRVTEDLNSSVEETRDSLNNLIQQVIPDLQNQIDGSIQSWDGTVEPTLGNYPASEWTTDTERYRHVGDVYYYYTGDGSLTYKFRKKEDGTYTWERVADSEAAAFERDLRELAGIVGTKNSVHFTDNVPTPPYIINDLWVKTDGSMYTCIAERGEGQIGGAADWSLFNDTMVRLAQMASDSVISKEEKAVLRDNWAQAQKEYATYQTQASTYGVSITNLTNAYNSLSSYLTDTVKINNNTDTSLTVQQKSEYNTRWANYYSERTEFANIVAGKIAEGAVGDIDIGIVNLLRDSDVELSGEGYNFGSYRYIERPKAGDELTIVVCYTLGNNNTEIVPYIDSNTGRTLGRFGTKGNMVIESYTATLSADAPSDYLSFFQFPNGTYGSKVHWAVLVKGNKSPMYWFPSPDDEKRGTVNLVSRKMMLGWNEKNKNIAVWGQDADGVYLQLDVSYMMNGGVAEGGIDYINNAPDWFEGKIQYKSNTQYVFSIEQKYTLSGARGIVPYILYTDGSRQVFYWNQSTSLSRSDFVSQKGKTINKIVLYISSGNCDSKVYSISLVEGNVIPVEIPTSEDDIWQSEVNLVDGGKEVTVTAGASSNYAYEALGVPLLKPNTVYTLSFEKIDVLAGSTDVVTVLFMDTSAGKYRSNIVDMPVGDKSTLLISTNDFSDGPCKLYVYAGDSGSTAGNSIRFSGISLVEGFVAPRSWSPSSGDLRNEIAEVRGALDDLDETINTTFKDGIIDETEANAIASNINILNNEKADIDAQYTELYNNTYLSGTPKTNLQSAKSAYNTAHSNLISAINTAIKDKKISDDERADVDAKFTAYATALGTYQKRVEEANKAIQDALKKYTDDEVDGIQIGARNLLLKSGEEVTNGSYNIKNYTTSVDLVPNGKYTVVLKCVTTGGQRLGVWFNGGNSSSQFFPANMDDSVEFIHVTAPSSITSAYRRQINIYNYPSSGSAANPATIRWIAMYEGHIKPPLDWVQAPEDIDQAIQDALAKTVQVTAGGQVFKYGAGYTGTPTPSSIVLTATAKNFTPTSYQWQYLNGSTWTNISGATSSTYTVLPSNTTLFPSGTNVRTFRCVCDGDEGKSDVFTLAKLADGAKGDTGDAGKGVKSTAVTYQSGTSGTTAPTGTWSGTIPSVAAGQYLWTRTVITYTDNSTSTLYSVGKMGDTGTPGTAGKGVKSTAIAYQAGSSGTTAPTGTWSSSIPSVAAGQYLWTRTTITYTDGTTSTIYSVGKMGSTGSPGADAYTVLLTNEAHTVACDSSGNPLGGELAKAVTDVQAYRGTTRLTAGGNNVVAGYFYIGTMTNTGGTFAKDGDDGIKCSAMTADTATCKFRVYLDNGTRYVEKTFVVTKAKAGASGKDGVGIKSVANKYAVSSSNTTAPTSWSDGVPTMTATNRYLWNYEIITYTDGSKSETAKRVIGVYGNTGAAGKGISSITEYYLASASASGVTTSTSGWTTSAQSTTTSKKYLWNYEVVTYTDGTKYTSTPVIIGTHGETGAKGDKGDAGKGVKSTAVAYQASSSGTTAPTGSWSGTIPSVAAGQYLWTRLIITYTDNTTSTVYSVGKMGSTGTPGNDGKGVKSTAITYQAGSSGTTAPTGTWSSSIPSVAAGQFLWTRTVITYTDNATSTIYSVGKMGETGSVGESLSGRMLYTDPTFKTGTNSVNKYSNSAADVKALLTVERVARPSDAPTKSGYCLMVTCKAAQKPGFGGVYQSISSRANAVFIQKIIAKLPVGYRLNAASNSMGSGYKDVWLTSTEGTGKYETYLRKVTCGASGTFSNGGHVYASGSPTPTEEAPLVWYIAYMTSFDQTDDGYEQIETASKDALAEKLGYGSWEEMVDKVSSAGSIIQGDYIRSTLIDVKTLAADKAFVEALTANSAFINDIKGISFDFQKGKVGGFSIDANALWAGSKFGAGYGIEMQSKTNDYRISAYKDAKNYVELFYRTAGWGLQGFSNGSAVFQLGDTNKIGPFVFGSSNLKSTSGTASLTLEADRIMFQDGSENVQIGVAGNLYGPNVGLGVQSKDIYHQGVIASAGNRQCRFYASAIYARGYFDMGSMFGIKPTYMSIKQSNIYLNVSSSFVVISSAERGGYVFNPPSGNWTGDSTFLFVVNWSGTYIEILRNDGGSLSAQLDTDKGVILIWNGSAWLPIMQGKTWS